MGAAPAEMYRHRAEEYRAFAAKAPRENERVGLQAVSELLEYLARTAAESDLSRPKTPRGSTRE